MNDNKAKNQKNSGSAPVQAPKAPAKEAPKANTQNGKK